MYQGTAGLNRIRRHFAISNRAGVHKNQADSSRIDTLMRTGKFFVVGVVGAVMLSACGLKGPLYLPSEEPDSEPTTTQDSEEPADSQDETKNTDDNGGGDTHSI